MIADIILKKADHIHTFLEYGQLEVKVQPLPYRAILRQSF